MLQFLKKNIFVLAIVGFCLSARPASAQFFEPENELLGKNAPDFQLTLASGAKSSLSQYRDGKSGIVFFWATWCPHCRTQLNSLNKIAPQLEQEGIKVILVDLGETASKVNSYLKKNNISLDVFLDQDSKVAEGYDIIGVPTFFFLSADGKIQAVEHEIPDNYKDILAGN